MTTKFVNRVFPVIHIIRSRLKMDVFFCLFAVCLFLFCLFFFYESNASCPSYYNDLHFITIACKFADRLILNRV